MKDSPATITIDETVYVRKDSVQNVLPPNGKRAVVVVDRGWIFAGDVEEKDGRILLSRAVHVLSWSSVGFDGMIRDPKSSYVKLRKLAAFVNLPSDSEIFRIPVDDTWGL